MAKTTTKVDARRRARERKAILDAERAERDAKIEEATVAYFEAQGAVEDLETQLIEARAQAESSVRGLLDLGETVDRVATLTELRTADVRRIKRETPASDATAAVAVDAPAAVAGGDTTADQSAMAEGERVSA